MIDDRFPFVIRSNQPNAHACVLRMPFFAEAMIPNVATVLHDEVAVVIPVPLCARHERTLPTDTRCGLAVEHPTPDVDDGVDVSGGSEECLDSRTEGDTGWTGRYHGHLPTGAPTSGFILP